MLLCLLSRDISKVIVHLNCRSYLLNIDRSVFAGLGSLNNGGGGRLVAAGMRFGDLPELAVSEIKVSID